MMIAILNLTDLGAAPEDPYDSFCGGCLQAYVSAATASWSRQQGQLTPLHFAGMALL